MRKVFGVIGAIALLIAVSACTPDGGETATPTATAIETPDASLIPPPAGADVKAVDSSLYDVGFSEFLFRAGEGPTWCTINADEQWVLCEQNEASATYKPVAPPADCEYSYGYQIKLYATQPENGQTAGFVCASGYYTDGSAAATLKSGEKITVGDITCYVAEVVARCDNKNGQYIALGSNIWAAQN